MFKIRRECSFAFVQVKTNESEIKKNNTDSVQNTVRLIRLQANGCLSVELEKMRLNGEKSTS